MRYQSDWSWKPGVEEKPKSLKKIKSKNKRNRRKNRSKVSKKTNSAFYKSLEWQELRARVLHKYDGKCMLCGRSPRIHGVVLHVDHIKPRRKFPELSLDFNNLQVLCGSCNRGKGNKFEKDFRPNEHEIDEELDKLTLNYLKGFI